MRQIRRISVILKALETEENKKKVLEHWLTPKEGVQLEIGMPFYDIENIIKRWTENQEVISKNWQNNIDLRLPQLLINSGIMPNYPGFYYHMEDEKTVIESGILEPEEIMFWGNSYDKDDNRLPETRWVLPKEMNTGHLKAILDLHEAGKMKLSDIYINIFQKELKNRE